jgi:dienelactone hydrolase
MNEQAVRHEFRGEALESVFVGTGGGSRATLICFPTVMGVTDLELGFARELAGRGYQVLVADLFGRRFTPGTDREEAFAAMTRLRSDRVALRDRLLSVLDTATAQPGVDGRRIAAIGYCFGGQCALDLARSGAGIAGAASFHGLFDPPGLPPQPIKAKVIAFHGWDDPMVPPEAVVALGRELTEGGADWQIHAYGNTSHGFTNPNASSIGVPGVDYNRVAADRSWAALNNFLDELFAA